VDIALQADLADAHVERGLLAGRGVLRVGPGPGRSVVTQAFATSPLRLLTPANHGRAAWIFTSTYGGGLVDGDRISLHATVEQEAFAFVSTQASTKVYRSARGSDVELHARVESGGALVLLPDPVVCFAASRYRQTQRVDLADGAALVLVDWISSGRRAAGERWAFQEYASRTRVRYDRRLVLHDATVLRALDGDLSLRMGRFEVLAMVVIVGKALLADAATTLTAVDERPVERAASQIVSVARLGEIGCVIRIAGRTVEQVGGRLRHLLGFVPALLGDDPWVRKW
jgi:urease accessory protein